MNRRELMRMGIGATGALLVTGGLRGAEPADDSDPAPLIAKIGEEMAKIPITSSEIGAGFDLLQGAGGNVAVLQGSEGLLVVDSGIPGKARELLEAVKREGGKPVSILVNTHWHFDHAGGNKAFADAGAKIFATSVTRKRLSTEQYTEVFKLTSPASPPEALPSLTGDHAELFVGDEVVVLTAVPPAHTDGDLIAHFKKHDVIHTGDLFSNGFYPNIDESSGGWIGGMIAAADRILKLAGPNTRIIPGHGPLARPADLSAFLTMLVTLYDRLSPMLDSGKTLEQAIAAKPTKDLDATWGKGFFNGGMFTRIAYLGLIKHRATAGK